MPLLEMRHIEKRFGQVKVLHGCDLVVESGSVHALLGENGAGKSTMMNVLTGSIHAEAGTVHFDGKDLFGASIKETEAAGIAFVHQELNLFSDLTVTENIFMGHELVNKFGKLATRAMEKRALDLFARLGVSIDPKAEVSELSQSERQTLEIAKALFFDAKLLVLDEPTTALTNQEVAHLFEIIRGLVAEGISFIFISHKMPEIFEICDSYTVMRNGHYIESGKISDTTPDKITQAMVGSALSGKDIYHKRELGDVIVTVESLSGQGFSDVNLTLRKGQVLGLTGLQGSGSSEFLQGLFGATRPTAGSVTASGKKLRLGNIKASMRAGLALLPSNRKDNSVIPDISILENQYVSEQVLSARAFWVNQKLEREKYETLKGQLNIKAEGPDAAITSLSGGNQQKVFIARWLNTQADVLFFDNPTQGIDVGAKAEIYRLILRLAEAGKCVVINTLEIPELREVADSCLVFYEGKVAVELTHDEIDERRVMEYSTASVLAANKGE